MDLTFWDFRTSFTEREAANLIVGQEPGETEYEPSVERRVKCVSAEIDAAAERAALFALENLKNIMPWNEEYPWSRTFLVGHLESNDLIEFIELVDAGVCRPTWEDFKFHSSGLQQFSREALQKWLTNNNIKSVYDFSCAWRIAERPDQDTSSNCVSENIDSENLGRRNHQIETILAVCAALEFDPMNIPTGGKAKVRSACLTRPKLFTESGFDEAWKQARDKELVRMKDHEKFISGRGGDH